jgi:hypothetical protein
MMFRELEDPVKIAASDPTKVPVPCDCGCAEPARSGDEEVPVPGKMVNDASVNWVLNG